MSNSLPVHITKENVAAFLSSFDNIITDCDGVIWHTDVPIPGASDVLNTLRSKGKRVFYITNNSTKTREQYLEKFNKLGFIASKEEVVGTSYVIAKYLKEINFTKTAYVVGTPGITGELDLVGIRHFGIGPDVAPSGDIFQLKKTVELDPEVGAVIVGFDPDFSYPKLMKAASYLKRPDVLFLCSNRDEVFPVGDNDYVFPGTGSLVQSVITASGRIPLIVGKPSPDMFKTLNKDHGLNPSRTIMIGDKCNTDILMGKNCGLKTLMVLSGITSWKEVISWASEPEGSENRLLLADYVIPSIGDLLKYI